MTWGKVGGQAPQGGMQRPQRRSRLSALLGRTLMKEALLALSVGSRGHGREHTLDLYVRSRASMWGGCIHEWALRRQRSGKLVRSGRQPE